MTLDLAQAFADFRQQFDLLEFSHAGLQRELIPHWLAQNCPDLSARIDSSAYGESPAELVLPAFERVGLGPQDSFLDLGCGAGNVVLLASHFTSRVYGLERNPRLCEAGRTLFRALGMEPSRIREADFMESEWPQATVLYVTSARLGTAVLKTLARRIEVSPARAVVSLGSTLPLPGSTWSTAFREPAPTRWNPGEAVLPELLSGQLRNP